MSDSNTKEIIDRFKKKLGENYLEYFKELQEEVIKENSYFVIDYSMTEKQQEEREEAMKNTLERTD